MDEKTIERLYEDIWLAHMDYSGSIFDTMYELIRVYIGKDDINNENILNTCYLDYSYVKRLEQISARIRHYMEMSEYLRLHNKLIEPFNEFLHKNTSLKPIPPYQAHELEHDPAHLKISNYIKVLNIMKLYDHYMLLSYLDNKRKDIKLVMFYETAIRFLIKEDRIINFNEILDNDQVIKKIVKDALEIDTGVDYFVTNLKKFNHSRNQMKHFQNYDIETNDNALMGFNGMILELLEKQIPKETLKPFDSIQCLYEYQLIFRELNFNKRVRYFHDYMDKILKDEMLFDIWVNDFAFQVAFINQILGGNKLENINDIRQIRQTITDFTELTNNLHATNEKINKALVELSSIDQTVESINEFNDMIKPIQSINLSNLKVLLSAELELPKNTSYKALIERLTKRTDEIDEITRSIRDISKKVKQLDKIISKSIEQKV